MSNSSKISTQPGLYRYVLVLQSIANRSGLLKIGWLTGREQLLREIIVIPAEDLCKLPAQTLAGYAKFLEAQLNARGIEYPTCMKCGPSRLVS